MLSLYEEINALCEGSSVGSEGNTRGVRAVEFKQGTCVDGEFAVMKKGLLFQVSYFF
jgi:hypothetical protein